MNPFQTVGVTGFGAVSGAAVSVFFAPETLGLSLLVGAIVGGGVGFATDSVWQSEENPNFSTYLGVAIVTGVLIYVYYKHAAK